jgi:protein-L-isoaspartate(D-aspartate) O-methyltransferase
MQLREQPNQTNDPYAIPRERMIEDQLRARGIVVHRVLEAMRAIPRHLFVSHELQDKAYADEALPSRDGQTISQPYMVAVMTQELDVREGMRVLEIGTGTGYQTAILAHLVGNTGHVYTIERAPALTAFAKNRLDAMSITNVTTFTGDGSAGWPQSLWPEPSTPAFDRILVTAGAPEVPDPLLAQLKPNGILIVPVGDNESQTLRKITKNPNNTTTESESIACRFVPLIGQFAWNQNPQP